MYNFIQDGTLFNLAWSNALLAIMFISIYVNYDHLHSLIIPAFTNKLDAEDRLMLYRHFRYYRKLSSFMKSLFEERVSQSLYLFDIRDSEGNKACRKTELILAGYASQLSFGFTKIPFKKYCRIILHKNLPEHSCKQDDHYFIDEDGSVHLCWKDLYYDLKNKRAEFPLGIRIFAKLLREENQVLNMDEFRETFKSTMVSKTYSSSTIKIREQAHSNQDFYSFLEDCVIRYHSTPLKFRNDYPRFFRHVDRMFYQRIAG